MAPPPWTTSSRDGPPSWSSSREHAAPVLELQARIADEAWPTIGNPVEPHHLNEALARLRDAGAVILTEPTSTRESVIGPAAERVVHASLLEAAPRAGFRLASQPAGRPGSSSA